MERFLPSPPYALYFKRGMMTQAKVLTALARREVAARYGRENIGFLWLVVEPMILTLGVMIMWSVIGKFKGPLPIIPFVLSGYALITLWRHITNSGIFFVRRSAGLLYHRQITLFDIFMSRIIVEFAGSTMAVCVLYFFVRVLGLSDPIDNFGTLALAWLLMATLATGIAGVVAAGTEYTEAIDRFVPALQYLILPLSGCFFMLDWIPPDQREVILYIPMVHAFEMFRDGYFGNSVVTYYSVPYLVVSCLVANAAGIWAIHRARDFVHIG